MADASGMIQPEEAVAPPLDDKPKKAKRNKAEDPRLIDKVVKFVQPWSWEVEKNEKKPIRLPGITDVVSLDRTGWNIVSRWAGIIGYSASLFNLLLVTIYACTVASQSTFGMLENAGWFVSGLAWFMLMVLATGIAAVLQLATDFGLPWAAGLAGEKYRMSPTAIIMAWLIFFMPTTLIMKYDLYSSWGHERQAEIVLKQTESENDAQVLAKFSAGPPAGIEASQAIIDAGPAALADLKDERERLVSARDQEKKFLGSTDTGMGPNWRKLNEQVLAQDALIRAQEEKVTTAKTALQDRKDYDAAKARREQNAKITANGGASLTLLYDNPIVIWLRVLGGAFVSMIAILVHFVALKKAAEEREAAIAKAEASERAKKGWGKRREKANTFDGDYEEAAPLGTKAIPDLGPVAPGAVAKADSHTRKETDAETHPDMAGDDYGVRPPATDEPEPELTTDDIVDEPEDTSDATDEPGQSQGQ